MADIDKAISVDEQIALEVRDRDKSMEVEVPEEEIQDIEQFEQLEDGTLIFGGALPPPENTDFYANLAEIMDDDDLARVKIDILDGVESDKASREDWEKTYRDGLEYLGMKYEDRTQPFEGASGVMHPLLAESVTQFQSQAYN